MCSGLWEGLKEECVRVCVCVFAYREKQSELDVFAMHCGELSIVTGAESGLLLPHLEEGMNLISRWEEKKKRREKNKRSS